MMRACSSHSTLLTVVPSTIRIDDSYEGIEACHLAISRLSTLDNTHIVHGPSGTASSRSS